MSGQREIEDSAFVHGITSHVSEMLTGKLERGEHPYLDGMTQKLVAKTIYYEDGTVETLRASDEFAVIEDPRRPIKEIVAGEYPSRSTHPLLQHLEQK